MFFLPSVECGKFKLKQAFQSGKILACSKKSEICAISILKLIKMMQKCKVAYASSTCMLYCNLIRQFYGIFCTLLLCGVAQRGRGHSTMVTAY